jgi:hydroxypyruvate isomerase
MHRRNFLSVVAGGFATSALTFRAAKARGAESNQPATPKRFTMNFAPHFGMFAHSAGKSLEDQLKFAADQGFTAWEDNGMKSRPAATQEKIARRMERLGMQMSVISALRGTWHAVTFAGSDKAARDQVLQSIKEIIDVAKRVNTKLLTVVPGMAHSTLSQEDQTRSCIELLKRCCDILAPHEQVMVIEPINSQKNQPGIFLSSAPHALEICRAVNHPSCKILFDIYHQQIDVGNLLTNIDRCWSETAYFQCGDAPTGKEPGTGEINYQNIMRHIHDKGYSGVVGMEHGNSKPGAAGERAVIEAYRRIDPA